MPNPIRHTVAQEVLAVGYPAVVPSYIFFDRTDFQGAWLFIVALESFGYAARAEVQWVTMEAHDKAKSYKARQRVIERLRQEKKVKTDKHAMLMDVAGQMDWAYSELAILLQDEDHLEIGEQGYAISYYRFISGGTRDGEMDRYHVVKNLEGRLEIVGCGWEDRHGVEFIPYDEPDRATPEEILAAAEEIGYKIEGFNYP